MGAMGSLTEIRHANWCSQGHTAVLKSAGLTAGDGGAQKLSINFFTFSFGGNDGRTVMPNSGFFIGLIVHVGTNTQTAGNTTYSIRAYRFSDDYTTRVTLGTVTVPAGETGCFYSDFLSEGTRRYFQYDGLEIAIIKSTGSQSLGTSNVEAMLGLEEKSDFFEGEYETPLVNN